MAHDLPQMDDRSKAEVAQMFRTVGNQVEGLNISGDGEDNGDDGPKVVDEIESLCMNCGENVRRNIVAYI